MLTLLGSLLGFLSAGIPKVLEYFEKKQENKLQLDIIKAQAAAAKDGHQLDIAMYNIKRSAEEQKMLLDHDIEIGKSQGWAGNLRTSVRPIITYAFFGVFAIVKLSLLYHFLTSGVDFNMAIEMIWDEETQAIFAAVISFWFGSRAIVRKG